MRLQELSSGTYMFSIGTKHCLICNVGFIGSDGGDTEESQGDPYSRFPLTGEDVQVLDKLFQLELKEEEKEVLVGSGIGLCPSSPLTSNTAFMTSTSSSYCGSCSYKVGILSQLWVDLEGIQSKINHIRTDFLQNIERTLPLIPQESSVYTIKHKVLEMSSRSQVMVTVPNLSKQMTCSRITPEEATTACGSGQGAVLDLNALLPATTAGDLRQTPQIQIESNNIKDFNPDPQDEPQPQLKPSSTRVEVKSQSQSFPTLMLIQAEDEHVPQSLVREKPISGDIIDDSDERQVESSCEKQGLSQQTVQESKRESLSGIERHEETATYIEDEKNASSVLTCPEVEQCGSEGFKSLKLLRRHFAKEHSASKKGSIFYKGQVKALTFKCEVCLVPSKCFSTPSHLGRHMRNVHGPTITGESLLCPEVEQCGSKKFGSLELLRTHFAKEHFMSEKNEILHKGRVQFLFLKCQECRKCFSRKHDFKKHKNGVHKVTLPSVKSSSLLNCPEFEKCDSEGFKSLKLLRRHFAKEHSASEKNVIFYKGQLQFLIFKCHVCPVSKGFSRRPDLNKHSKRVHKVAIIPELPSLPSSIDENAESAMTPMDSKSGSDFDHSQSSNDSDMDHSNKWDHSSSSRIINIKQPPGRREGLRRERAVKYSAVLDPEDSDNIDNDDDIDWIRPTPVVDSKDTTNLTMGTSQHTPTPLQSIPESQGQCKEESIKIDITYEAPEFSTSTDGVPSEEIIPRVLSLAEDEEGSVMNEVTVDESPNPNPHPSPPGKGQGSNTTMTPAKRKRGRPRKYSPTPRPIKMTKVTNLLSDSENGSKPFVASKPRGRPKSTGNTKSLISLNCSQRSIAQPKRKLDPMNRVSQNRGNPNLIDNDDNIRDTEKFQFMIPILRLHRLQLP